MTTFDKIMAVLLTIVIAAAMILLNSCQMPSVIVHGKLGDYTFTPRPPVAIKSAK